MPLKTKVKKASSHPIETGKSSLQGTKSLRKARTGDGGKHVVIHRSKLNNASYNPRKIDPVSAKRLRESIERTGGLISPPLWNETTGNIVSGHQRLAQLDLYMKTQDYELTVVQVRWTLEKEKAVNVALNSQLLTGEYDLDKLDALLETTPEIDLSDAGLDLSYLEMMHIDQGIDLPEFLLTPEDLESDEALEEEGLEDDVMDTLDEADAAEEEEERQTEIKRLKERREAFNEEQAFKQQLNVSFRVVCPSERTCQRLMELIGIKHGSAGDFVDGLHLADLLGHKQALKSILNDERPVKRKLAPPPKKKIDLTGKKRPKSH